MSIIKRAIAILALVVGGIGFTAIMVPSVSPAGATTYFNGCWSITVNAPIQGYGVDGGGYCFYNGAAGQNSIQDVCVEVGTPYGWLIGKNGGGGWGTACNNAITGINTLWGEANCMGGGTLYQTAVWENYASWPATSGARTFLNC